MTKSVQVLPVAFQKFITLQGLEENTKLSECFCIFFLNWVDPFFSNKPLELQKPVSYMVAEATIN